MTENVNRLPKKRNFKKYSAEEFFEFTKGREERYELIDGQIRLMASPSTKHQRISRKISNILSDYFKDKTCEPFYSPLDVVLFQKTKKDDSRNIFQPDIFVVCDPNKITEKRIVSAPDFIIEIVSPSNPEDDYIDKLVVYMKYGVREYWIVNPDTRKILVYIKDKEIFQNDAYTFEDKIKVSIFEDLEIDFKNLNLL